MSQNNIVIILSVLLLAFLLWKEFRRVNRANLPARIVATVVAVLMFTLIFIPVRFSRTVNGGTLPQLLLITKGSNQIPTAEKYSRKVTTYRQLASPTVEYIPDLSGYITQHGDQLSGIHITGTGIAEHEWKLLDKMNMPAQYTPPADPKGIIQADWQRVIPLGDKLQVYGMFNNTGEEEVRLVLSGLGSSFDSVTIRKDSAQDFLLSCRTVHEGNSVYEIQVIRDGNIIATEKIPVFIQTTVKPAVLLLSSSPGFENKFLGTWLYEHDYPVAVRSSVSRGKYDQQFLNMKATAINNINSSLLERFDVVIADDNALSELNSVEVAAIKLQLEKGMGLIIQSDTSTALSHFSRSFSLTKQPAGKSLVRSLTWVGSGSRIPLTAEQWISIQPDPMGRALVTDEKQAVIVSSRLYGPGRIILSTAGSTYGWMLSGSVENYSSFWSLLISKAARRQKPAAAWRQSTRFPAVDDEVKLLLELNTAEPPVIKTAAGELYTAQTPYLPDTWTARWWPAGTGWQTLSCTDTASVYVFEEKDWSAAKQFAQINENITLSARHTSAFKETTAAKTEMKTVPVYIFYIVFLSAVAFLWWEGKRNVGR